MDDAIQSTYDRLSAIYASGEVPWDAEEPPPEVLDYLADVRPGRALDLGCGYGRAAIYMASLGWEVDAIDFIPEALAEAKQRAAQAQVEVRFHQTKITELQFLDGLYDFGLDVGCGHNLVESELKLYRDHLIRLLRPNGVFLLFARLLETSSEKPADSPRGVDQILLEKVFTEGFNLDWMEPGRTQAGDNDSWSSAWFRFRRI